MRQPPRREDDQHWRPDFAEVVLGDVLLAAGDCACTGGLFAGSYACEGAVETVVRVDLRIPGCPPSPSQLLAGLVSLLESSAKGR